MQITEKWLKEKNACSAGIEWFKNQTAVDAKDVIQALIKAEKFQWANWCISRLFEHRDAVRYALFSTKLVI